MCTFRGKERQSSPYRGDKGRDRWISGVESPSTFYIKDYAVLNKKKIILLWNYFGKKVSLLLSLRSWLSSTLTETHAHEISKRQGIIGTFF